MAAKVGPSWELQKAVAAILQGDSDLASLMGGQTSRQFVFEDVQADKASLPYIVIGECQDIADLAECIDGSTLYCDLHVWSGASSFKECKSIIATAWASLAAATITLVENRCIDLNRDGSRTFVDADGLTKHGVLTIRTLTEPL